MKKLPIEKSKGPWKKGKKQKINSTISKLDNSKDFHDFLIKIDSLPQLEIELYMNSKGQEYIDTPGFYSKEKDDYHGIEDFMISNMGAKAFDQLKKFYEIKVKK